MAPLSLYAAKGEVILSLVAAACRTVSAASHSAVSGVWLSMSGSWPPLALATTPPASDPALASPSPLSAGSCSLPGFTMSGVMETSLPECVVTSLLALELTLSRWQTISVTGAGAGSALGAGSLPAAGAE